MVSRRRSQVRLIWFIVLVAVLAIPAMLTIGQGAMQGTVITSSVESEALGQSVQFHVYLPAGYDMTDAHYPSIYLLHGRGDTMDAWLKALETLEDLIAEGDIPPVIAIMPDAPFNSAASYYVDSRYVDGYQVETALIEDLIPHIDLVYRTEADRSARVIGGYSMGGYGALRYALAHPERFGAAIVLSPAVYTPLSPEDSSTREFGAFGNGSLRFDPEVYQQMNYPALLESFRTSNFYTYLFVAVGDDEWKHPDAADQLHDLDVEAHLFYNRISRIASIASEFRVYDGGHDWSVWKRGFAEGAKFTLGRLPGGALGN